jgi:hypothetical protein
MDEEEKIDQFLSQLADDIGITEDEAHEIFGTCAMCGEVSDMTWYFDETGLQLCFDCEKKLWPFFQWKMKIEGELGHYRNINKGVTKLVNYVKEIFRRWGEEEVDMYETQDFLWKVIRKYGWKLFF